MVFNIGLMLLGILALMIFYLIYKAFGTELPESLIFLEKNGIKIEQNNDTSLLYKYNVIPTPIKPYKFKLLGENIHKVKEAIFEGDSVYFIKLDDDSYFFKRNGLWHLRSKEHVGFRIYNPKLLKCVSDIESYLKNNCKKEENPFYDAGVLSTDIKSTRFIPRETKVVKSYRGPSVNIKLLKFKSDPILYYHVSYGDVEIFTDEGVKTYRRDENNGLWYEPELVFIHGRKKPECYLSKEDSKLLNQTLERV